MARKVFLSFLGTSNYLKSKYYINNVKDFVETRFVQIASFKFHCSDFDENDKVLVFTTDTAKIRNWNDDFEFNKPCSDEKIKNKGLKTEFKNIDIKIDISDDTAVWIPEENSEDEIWETFKIVFDQLEIEDEIVFDITHGFRSSPMLLMVMINYAKFLKKIIVRKIVYGAFEARSKENETKIWDLTNFAVLQDWTTAANEFLNFSNVDRLIQLSNEGLSPLLKSSQGTSEVLKELKRLNQNLPRFVDNIITCRGKEIIKNDSGKRIIENLDNINQNVITPLSPILTKLKEQIISFNEPDNIYNGLHAVKWCIDNNLHQQGFTILEETLINFVCNELHFDVNNKDNRIIVSACFSILKKNIPKNEWKVSILDFQDMAEYILEKSVLIKQLCDEFAEVVGIRNDINHAGFSNRDTKAKKIKDNLNLIYKKVILKLTSDL
jgi:CRISPR-associated Csx2 family protein